VTRRAVDALTAMVQSVRGHALPYPRADVIAELTALRDGLRESRPPYAQPATSFLYREELEPKEPDGEATLAASAAASQAQRQPEPEPQPEPQQPQPQAQPEPQPQPVAEVAPAQEAAPAEEVPAGFEAGKEQRRIKDDVDRDLLPIFLDEAKEILPQVSEGVRRWKLAPADHTPIAELVRHLHTLKGSARMTGLMRLGELAHVLETRIIAMDAVDAPESRKFEEVEERVDRFSLSLERLARGEDILEAEPIDVPAAASSTTRRTSRRRSPSSPRRRSRSRSAMRCRRSCAPSAPRSCA
jgi:chemosensory pili system protein ChpA (sensor histidine kinase/response regulator)